VTTDGLGRHTDFIFFYANMEVTRDVPLPLDPSLPREPYNHLTQTYENDVAANSFFHNRSSISDSTIGFNITVTR